MKKYLLFFLIPCLFACNSAKSVIDDIALTVHVQRLDHDLSKLSADSLPIVRERYGAFFEIYNTSIIAIGHSTNPLYLELVQNFLHHDVVKEAYQGVAEAFPNEEKLDEQFTNAFKYLTYHFPEMLIPSVVAYVSGFNEAIVLTDSVIGIGLDRFLGGDYPLYSQLGFPRFLQQTMTPERVAIMSVHNWLASDYQSDINGDNTLLARMIHEGKLLYALRQCFPDCTEEMNMGYTQEQYSWCEANEQQMWETLIEKKMLYLSNQLTIQKLTSDSPFTSEFSSAAPGKVCCWIGYRIVSEYMKKNPGLTLPELMEQGDAQMILKESRYNP